MLFNSLEFIVFFVLVYAAYRVLPSRGQNILLLVASYLFYGAWDYRFLSLLLLSTVMDFYCARKIGEGRHRKAILLVSVVGNLTLLGFFKYFNFFQESMAALLSRFSVDVDPFVLGIVLPVGISFYTFQEMSYTIDVYHGRLEPEQNIFDFALFVCFFPQLVAGPIERAESLLSQITADRKVSIDDWAEGLWLVLLGYFQKVFVADNLSPIVERIFANTGTTNGILVLLGLYAFAFQIYGDFAGYSNIARGVARLMGFRLMINFRTPYFSQDPSEFWRRWHISLSTWLRDYLYIPLGGNRGSKLAAQRNLMLTMLLGGLWHGAAWTFVVWGAYQGALLVVFRQFGRLWNPELDGGGGLLQKSGRIFVMFHLTCIGWLFFRASSMEQVVNFARSLAFNFTFESGIGLGGFVTLANVVALAIVLDAFCWWKDDELAFLRWPAPLRTALAASMLFAIMIHGNFGRNEFIYFQF